MKSATRPLLVSIALVAVLLALLVFTGGSPGGAGSLLLYCAASMKAPVEAIARDYAMETGVNVQLQYGGSGTLLGNLEASKQGDLFLAADESYVAIARDRGLVTASFPVVVLRPVLAVPAGNPKAIQDIADLLREDVRVALANPDAAAIGKTARQMLEQRGAWANVEEAVRARGVFKPTVSDVANDVRIGTVDAGIIWDATAGLHAGVEAVALPGAAEFERYVTLGVLASTADRAAAERFARYLAAPAQGQVVFKAHGFTVVHENFQANPADQPALSGPSTNSAPQ